jgi:hypothetical protein
VGAQNQPRAFLIAGWKSGLEPFTHSILVFAKQTGDFLNRVVAVDFDKAMIGVTFSQITVPQAAAVTVLESYLFELVRRRTALIPSPSVGRSGMGTFRHP